MKNKKKWSVVAVSALTVPLLLTACGPTKPTATQSSNKTGSSSDSNQPEETLTMYDQWGVTTGLQTGWFAKLVKDKFNIKLNVVSNQGNKLATLMAAGNLGDIVIFGSNGQDYQNAIKAGLVLDWTKNGLLDKYGQDILKNAGQAIEANKKQFGNGTAVYGMGSNAGDGKGPSEGTAMASGPDLRWDLYQKLGSPKLNTIDDYLPLLKKMQQLEPKSDSGKPTYGFSLWTDWDGAGAANVGAIASMMSGWTGGDGFNQSGLIWTQVGGTQYQGIIDDNSYYMQALQFLHKAYQMGLVDPDSITQKGNDAFNKMKDGQTLFSLFSWMDAGSYDTPNHTSVGKGFKYVPFASEKMTSNGYSPYGGPQTWFIGSKTKDPARIMKLYDWLTTPEGILEANYGPKGLAWDLDSNGKPYVTDFGWKAFQNGDTPVPAKYGGGTWASGNNPFNINLIQLTTIDPQTGEPYEYDTWTSTLKHKPDPVTTSWRNAMGVLTPKDYVVKHNLYVLQPQFFNGKAPVNEPSDIKQKETQVDKVIAEYSWKMMYAKSDAEYNSLNQEMVAKAKGLGYDDVIKWAVEQAKNTVWAKSSGQ